MLFQCVKNIEETDVKSQIGHCRNAGYDSKEKKNILKVYAVTVTIIALLLSVAFTVVFHHAGYDTKLLAKLGLIERVEKIDWAVVGWNNTLNKLGYDADIVFFGDSITSDSDFRIYFPDKKIVNLGYPGDDLGGMIERIEGIQSLTPELVFVLGGINGLKDNNLDVSVSKYEELLGALVDALPNSDIIVQSVLPIAKEKESEVCTNTTIVEFNNQLKSMSKEYGVIFVDIYSVYESKNELDPASTEDGIHISPEAYGRWAKAIEEYVQ